MSISSTWLETWIKEHGPYLWHLTHEPKIASLILREGLKPWNETKSASRMGAPWTPREGHVYLGTPAALKDALRSHLEGSQAKCLLGIDLGALDPNKLNADEDAFWSATTLAHRSLWDEGMGLDDPFLLVADEFSVENWDDLGYSVHEVIPISDRPYEDYGQWAQANNLGANPAHTRLSLEEAGTIAYQGVVSPEFIFQAADHPEVAALISELI